VPVHSQVILLGARGWLGSAIFESLPNVIAVSTSDVLRKGAQAVLTPIIDAAQDRRPIIVNAAGSKSEAVPGLAAVNADLVADLAKIVQLRKGWLVHFGSAAEYGLGPETNWIDDATGFTPSTPYGQTKHAGSLAALHSGHATVLRPFNLFDRVPQPGSPLADILARALLGIKTGQPMEVLSANTSRDYVSRAFVVASTAKACELRPSGQFNLCSGSTVMVGDIVANIARLLHSHVQVADTAAVPASSIAADPGPWESATGLAMRADAQLIAETLVAGLPSAASPAR